MLTATRDHDPRMGVDHFGPPPRTMFSRFTSGVQLVGSLIGIPLALVGGYSTYHATFSPEAKCQSLRANIIAMLDKKADASTLRMLVHRDVVTFERECDVIDADAVAAFKTLLVAEKPVTQRSARAKADAVLPQRTAKADAVTKVEKSERSAKGETARIETPKTDPAKIEEAKPEQPKFDVAKIEAVVKSEAQKPAENAMAMPSEPASENRELDAIWVASVRDVLRESSLRAPAGESAAPPMPPAIVLQPANSPMRQADHPVPPAAIPQADVIAPAR